MTAKITSASALTKAVQGNDPLASLAKHGALSRSGAAWVKAALDPFHDFEIQGLEGLPDLESEPSLVVSTQQSTTISAPAGTTGSWDANVAIMPIDFSKSFAAPGVAPFNVSIGSYYPYGSNTNSPGSFDETVASTNRMDGLQISSVPSGNTFITTDTRNNISLDDYVEGEDSDLQIWRVVSSAFEVVNTTAPLNRAGAVTVYEIGQPGEVSSAQHNNNQSSPSFRAGTVRNFRMPPTSLQEAKQTPGARTWEAAEGCYCVAKHRAEMAYSPAAKRDFVYAGTSLDESYMSNNMGYIQGSTATVDRQSTVSHISNLNTTGAYFTGLSTETTLVITWRCIIERLPGPQNLQNLALASPSAIYDPAALELYSHITARLAPGVPVSYNDMGKYFRMIASTIRDAAKLTLPLLPAFETALIATGHPNAARSVELLRKVQANSKNGKPKRSVPNMGKP
jgi:hypothetical protein